MTRADAAGPDIIAGWRNSNGGEPATTDGSNKGGVALNDGISMGDHRDVQTTDATDGAADGMSRDAPLTDWDALLAEQIAGHADSGPRDYGGGFARRAA